MWGEYVLSTDAQPRTTSATGKDQFGSRYVKSGEFKWALVSVTRTMDRPLSDAQLASPEAGRRLGSQDCLNCGQVASSQSLIA